MMIMLIFDITTIILLIFHNPTILWYFPLCWSLQSISSILIQAIIKSRFSQRHFCRSNFQQLFHLKLPKFLQNFLNLRPIFLHTAQSNKINHFLRITFSLSNSQHRLNIIKINLIFITVIGPQWIYRWHAV